MRQIELASGRKILVLRVDIEDVHAFTVGEGANPFGLKRDNDLERASLLKHIRDNSLVTNAILILDDGEDTQARYRYIFELRSDPIEARYDASILAVCFYMDDVDVNLHSLLQQKLWSIDWDSHAGDLSVLSGRSRGL